MTHMQYAQPPTNPSIIAWQSTLMMWQSASWTIHTLTMCISASNVSSTQRNDHMLFGRSIKSKGNVPNDVRIARTAVDCIKWQMPCETYLAGNFIETNTYLSLSLSLSLVLWTLDDMSSIYEHFALRRTHQFYWMLAERNLFQIPLVAAVRAKSIEWKIWFLCKFAIFAHCAVRSDHTTNNKIAWWRASNSHNSS